MDCILFYLSGLMVAFAYDDISYNKFATQSHTWIGTGYDAANAVDGNPATCMRTRAIGLNSVEKTLWWKVDLGGVYNIYRVNIQYKQYEGYEIRQRGRLAGFSLYVSNTGDIQGSTLCYKDGPQLPPLNLTITCTKSGRYVTFYNERLDGVTYPKGYEPDNVNAELCQVTVQGCQNASFYGSNCNTPCPQNCEDSTCHIQSGACFTCKPGWSGVECDAKCREGWYGINCSQQCTRHCRDEAFCNHVTGLCDRGCAAGWTGVRCDAECEDGTYGYNCVDNCSGHCLNDSQCNKQTGHCDGGCNPGYANSYCSKECLPGKFGQDCNEPCSSYCIHNEPCNHVSGECPSGCQDGFVGKNCNDYCKKGYFGRNCAHECSPNCNLDTCQNTDGWCVCADGLPADNCTIEKRKASQQSSLPNNLAGIVGATVGASVFVVIGVILASLAIRLKRKSTKMAKRQSFMMEATPIDTKKPKTALPNLPSCTSQTLHANAVRESTYALPEKTKRGPPTNKNIPVRNMKAQITNMSLNENAGFKSEYHDIPRGELHPCTEGKKPENKVKNRYTTIFPYDHSLVILKNTASDQGGYINANYIEDTRERRTYIATQGPKPKTIADFWTMIWQEEVCNIVCLTNLTEGTKVNTYVNILQIWSINIVFDVLFIIASRIHQRYDNQKLRFCLDRSPESLR